MKKILTLCLIQKNDSLLLGLKKRGFGAGRWNGFGGKVKEDESIEEAARREVNEEAGIELLDLERRGVLNFKFVNDPEVLEVHVFGATEFSGEPIETEEMKPQWFLISAVPYDQMWPDDRHWLPLLLEGKNFRGDFYFENNDNLISYNLRELEI